MEGRSKLARAATIFAWLLAVACTSASTGTLAVMLSVMAGPNPFGHRDGQGAAGLAAMILLGALAAAVLAGAVATWLAMRLRRDRVRHVLPVTVAAPAALALLGVILQRLP